MTHQEYEHYRYIKACKENALLSAYGYNYKVADKPRKINKDRVNILKVSFGG